MDSVLLKFRAKFIEEANGLLDQLENDLLGLEKAPENKELIESAFRAMHTIKGVSGMYGFDAISEYTHHFESIYQSIRDKKKNFSKPIFDISFTSIDHLRKLLTDNNILTTNLEIAEKHQQLVAEVQGLLNEPVDEKTKSTITEKESEAEKKAFSTYNILLNSNEHLYFRGVSITGIFKELAGLGNFYIEKVPNLSDNDSELWSIFLTSEVTIDDVRDVLMFIEDECIVKKVASGILQPEKQPIRESINNAVQNINIETAITHEDESVKTFEKNETTSETENNQVVEISNAFSSKQTNKRISVDSSKLDQLMFLVSELITVNSQLVQDLQIPAYEPLRSKIEKIDNLSKLFRNNALEIRLIPLSDTILRFQRLIRDLSAHLGKKVELKTQGIDTELDKNTVDQLSEPLMHIIRNSIDHGIETPEQRIKKGKAEVGTIEITAYQSGNFVFISIKDDGEGIDLEKIRHKAIEKGLIDAKANISRAELIDIIFEPGFSTAKSLTEVSGRGVGMDVVRKKITDLRGEIIVDSEMGIGTNFTLKIQQSLSILDSLLFKVENSYFTVPVSDIEVCEQIDIQNIDNSRHTSTINYNDNMISFIDLRKALNIKGKYDIRPKEIIVRNNDKTFAILADQIIGEHQAVLKPLGKAFNEQNLIVAASQLGDGHIALMLDTNALSRNLAKLI